MPEVKDQGHRGGKIDNFAGQNNQQFGSDLSISGSGINLVVRIAQFAHDNPKLRGNRRVGGNFLRSMFPAENVQLFDQRCNIQNTAGKLRNSVFSKHLPPLSTRPFTVAHAQYVFSEKHYMCLLRALWMTAVALAYVVYWVREQSSMSCRETEEHRFDDVIQNGAHIAWQASSMVEQATESPAYYHLFPRNHASQKKTETNSDICIHKVPLRSDYWQLVIGNSLLNLSIRLWENSFTFGRCVVAVPRSGPADWRCLCWPQT